jgi:hypothetical protein
MPREGDISFISRFILFLLLGDTWLSCFGALFCVLEKEMWPLTFAIGSYYVPGWPGIRCVTQFGFKLMILLLKPLGYWDCRCMPPYWAPKESTSHWVHWIPIIYMQQMHIKVFRLKAFLDLKLLVLTSNPFRKHC